MSAARTRLEPLAPTHAAVAAALNTEAMAAATGDGAWTADAIRSLLGTAGISGWLAVAPPDDRPIGFVLMRKVAEEAEILTLAVSPAAQRRGAGRHLMRRAIEAGRAAGARTLFLEVAADNGPALALYRALGFAEVGRRAGYYARSGRPAMDALTLALALGLDPAA